MAEPVETMLCNLFVIKANIKHTHKKTLNVKLCNRILLTDIRYM